MDWIATIFKRETAKGRKGKRAGHAGKTETRPVAMNTGRIEHTPEDRCLTLRYVYARHR